MTALRNEKGQFVKGCAAGPGRPKLGTTLADILRVIGQEKDGENTNLEILVRNLFEQAKGGDIPSISIVLNRMFGKEADIIHIDTEEMIDLSKLSDEELVMYNKLLGKIENESTED